MFKIMSQNVGLSQALVKLNSGKTSGTSQDDFVVDDNCDTDSLALGRAEDDDMFVSAPGQLYTWSKPFLDDINKLA